MAIHATMADGAPRETSELRRAMGRLLRRKSAVLGLVIALLLVTLALLAPLVAPFDPVKQSYTMVRKAPSALHWFGTDESGRDILSRVIHGARASLMAGFASVVIALSIGVPHH
jgi:peptide/nickel transport system permease protein